MSKHHVIPRLKPGGRKTLKDGLITQGVTLLFHNLIVLPKKAMNYLQIKKIPGATAIHAVDENTDIGLDLPRFILVWFV